MHIVNVTAVYPCGNDLALLFEKTSVLNQTVFNGHFLDQAEMLVKDQKFEICSKSEV